MRYLTASTLDKKRRVYSRSGKYVLIVTEPLVGATVSAGLRFYLCENNEELSNEDLFENSNLLDYEKNMVNYAVVIDEADEIILIHFQAKLLAAKYAKKYNRMVLGRDTKYWIRKEDFSIEKRLFSK